MSAELGDLPVFVTAQPAYSGERARLEWLMAYGVMSPEDKARWEELRAPEAAALKASIDRELMDEIVRPAMGLRSRSCPSCHSIGPADDGCADAWHEETG